MGSDIRRLLVVEDIADARDFMVLALERGGFAVDTAPDGLDALKRLKLDPPPHYDLIVLDLVLPRLNGLELMAELEADPLWRAVPVLIATATVVFARQFSGVQRVSILRKPFSAEQLTTAVEALLYRRTG